MRFWKTSAFVILGLSTQVVLAQELLKESSYDESKINYAAKNLPYNGEPKLEIFVYPPSKDLDWSSPKLLLYSFLGGEIVRQITLNDSADFTSDDGNPGTMSTRYRSSMGHTLGHVQCKTRNGSYVDKWVSFSGQNFASVDKDNAFNKQLGMGMLFEDYNDGHIVNGHENQVRIALYRDTAWLGGLFGSNEPRYIRYIIGPKECENLQKMINFFLKFNYAPGTTYEQLQAREPYNVLYFTANMDPYETYLARKKNPKTKVGGGCAPFGAALVRAAGYYESIYDTEWKFPKDVSERLIGGKDKSTGEVRKVSMLSLLDPEPIFGLGWKWTHKGYKSRRIVFTDPKMIWDFVGKGLDCVADNDCEPEAKQWLGSNLKKEVSVGPTLKFTSEGHTNEVEGIVVRRRASEPNDWIQ